jgi:hypothetical protein
LRGSIVWAGETLVELTSDVTGAVGEFLDFFLCEDAKDDDEVLTLLEALVGFLESFGVDEAAIDLGPAGSWWNAFLVGLRNILLAMF